MIAAAAKFCPSLALALGVALSTASAAPSARVTFSPHRAVYDLKLKGTQGVRNVEAVRGHILYDFSGSACAGYTLNFRQVSELEAEGRTVLSDLTATSWEAGNAKRYRFNSLNRMNEQLTDTAAGEADRKRDAVDVRLTKPKRKVFDLAQAIVFPTEHMRRIVAAARAGQRMLEFPVYDGSETGEKVYNTFTLIGKAIPPGAAPPPDAAAKVPALAKLTRWPVTISYFEQRKPQAIRSGEQTPSYTIAFELYENGVSRALVLDYNDFTISGTLSSLEMKPEKPCK